MSADSKAREIYELFGCSMEKARGLLEVFNGEVLAVINAVCEDPSLTASPIHHGQPGQGGAAANRMSADEEYARELQQMMDHEGELEEEGEEEEADDEEEDEAEQENEAEGYLGRQGAQQGQAEADEPSSSKASSQEYEIIQEDADAQQASRSSISQGSQHQLGDLQLQENISRNSSGSFHSVESTNSLGSVVCPTSVVDAAEKPGVASGKPGDGMNKGGLDSGNKGVLDGVSKGGKGVFPDGIPPHLLHEFNKTDYMENNDGVIFLRDSDDDDVPIPNAVSSRTTSSLANNSSSRSVSSSNNASSSTISSSNNASSSSTSSRSAKVGVGEASMNGICLVNSNDIQGGNRMKEALSHAGQTGKQLSQTNTQSAQPSTSSGHLSQFDKPPTAKQSRTKQLPTKQLPAIYGMQAWCQCKANMFRVGPVALDIGLCHCHACRKHAAASLAAWMGPFDLDACTASSLLIQADVKLVPSTCNGIALHTALNDRRNRAVDAGRNGAVNNGGNRSDPSYHTRTRESDPVSVVKHICRKCQCMLGMTIVQNSSASLAYEEVLTEFYGHLGLSGNAHLSNSSKMSSTGTATNRGATSSGQYGSLRKVRYKHFFPASLLNSNNLISVVPSQVRQLRIRNYAKNTERACWFTGVKKCRLTRAGLRRKEEALDEQIMQMIMKKSIKGGFDVLELSSDSESDISSAGRVTGINDKSNRKTDAELLDRKGGAINDLESVYSSSDDEGTIVVDNHAAISRQALENKDDSRFLRGSCVCGKCVFELFHFPEEIQHCYCGMCRSFSGGSCQTWAALHSEQFRWIRGHSDGSLELVKTSSWAARHCCTSCGTHLSIVYSGQGDVVWLAVGAIDFAHEKILRRRHRLATKRFSTPPDFCTPVEAPAESTVNPRAGKQAGDKKNTACSSSSISSLKRPPQESESSIEPRSKVAKVNEDGNEGGTTNDSIDENPKKDDDAQEPKKPVFTNGWCRDGESPKKASPFPSKPLDTSKGSDSSTRASRKAEKKTILIPEIDAERQSGSICAAEVWCEENLAGVKHICCASKPFWLELPKDDFIRRRYAS